MPRTRTSTYLRKVAGACLLLLLSSGLMAFKVPSDRFPLPLSETTGMPAATLTSTTTANPTSIQTTAASTALPRFDHIVIVVEENKDYAQVIGPNTPDSYINSLAAQGMLFTNSHALTHPSQPNYLGLFSGSNQGVTGDSCDPSTVFPQPDLGGQLISAGLSFAGYSENMPSAGYTGCFDTPLVSLYVRKHNPWANFSDVNGPQTNLPFTSFPTTPDSYSSLPTVSFVIPNLLDDMHESSAAINIQQGDTWLKQKLDGYAQWARTHNSLLIVTWDEEDELNGIEANSNQVATIFVGQHVALGTNDTNISHYNILRTIENMYGLPLANNAANVNAITGVWN